MQQASWNISICGEVVAMKERLALIGVLAIVLATTGCAWVMTDSAALVIYRRQGTGSKGSIFISMWQLTIDVNGKITVVANPDTPLLRTVPKVDLASSESMAELRSVLDSEEMQSLRPEQLLEASRKVKAPEYTYTLLYRGRVLQAVAGAVPPEMIPALRLLDQKLQLMDSQATAPGVDQFGTIQLVTATPARPSPIPLTPTRPSSRGTATPVRRP
jgi:hypothetical protein